jgi:hypothetical protein
MDSVSGKAVSLIEYNFGENAKVDWDAKNDIPIWSGFEVRVTPPNK